VALIGILVRQYGQSLVVGSDGGASSFFLSLFIFRITIKIAKAMTIKLIIVFMKTP
jgi:hypothetical protein